MSDFDFDNWEVETGIPSRLKERTMIDIEALREMNVEGAAELWIRLTNIPERDA